MNKPTDSFNIRSVTFPNRIGMSPMCQYSAGRDGIANEWHFVHYGSRAVGGTGLILLEATAVTPEGRISSADLGIWDDGQIPQLRRITSFIRERGAVAGIQLAHAGRKASRSATDNRQLSSRDGGWDTVGPSPLPFIENEIPPVALDLAGVHQVIQYFTSAAQRALKAGFQVIEIHAAHGYLLHEFLSPLSNYRQDAYGGSFENRCRLLLEITENIRRVWPDDLALFVRLSATEWTEGGWNPEDTVTLAAMLKARGVDLIDCSSGGNVANAVIPVGPGYQVPFAARVRQTGILTAAVGLITSMVQATEIIETGKADLVFFGRELLRNPYLVMDNQKDNWPVQYFRAK